TETETSSSPAEATDGSTLTVQAGEGVGQLAARGGISIAELERLNPEKMTTGSWIAHPGDVVRIR
ncbi:SAG1386/EF1546 family surface-associated protein, partial [Streptococcus suis]